MPLPYGWGTGGIQLTASANRSGRTCSRSSTKGQRRHHQRGLHQEVFPADHRGARLPRRTGEATLIQTRHRIPETPLRTEDQTIILPGAHPRAPALAGAPGDGDTRSSTPCPSTELMYVKLYEDITRHGRIATGFDYPAMVADRYLMSPSPIPKFDNPKLDNEPLPSCFSGPGGKSGSTRYRPLHQGQEPGLRGPSLYQVETWDRQKCALCGSADILFGRDHHRRLRAGGCSSARTRIYCLGPPPGDRENARRRQTRRWTR